MWFQEFLPFASFWICLDPVGSFCILVNLGLQPMEELQFQAQDGKGDAAPCHKWLDATES